VYDHVLGAETGRFPFRPPYTHQTPFHEPFVLFGYLAAVTQRIELVTGILVLPQRQTALVAKQAAEVDVLSGGRLRLGAGIGWNFVEYEALGANFKNRGRRVEEQIALLRRLWCDELVDFDGRYHHIQRAGINPLPVQRPIPLWMGAMAEPAVRRAAAVADGWFPQFPPDENGRSSIERFRGYARDAGRDPASIGIEGRVTLARTPEAEWGATMDAWRSLGASHVSFNTIGADLPHAQAHIDALGRFQAAASA
jgi:probable F420-dependent oxidoreductase